MRHEPRRHAAIRTADYVFSQLIPYLGNKRKLLPLIARGLRRVGDLRHARGTRRAGEVGGGGGCGSGIFVDLFTGSTVVARFAKTLGFRVLANDWEPYSSEIARGTVALNSAPSFEHLGGAARAFEILNALPPLRGYVARHLCPESDSAPDTDDERMFFTRANGERIDAVREQLAAWELSRSISEAECAYVLSALLYSVSYVSNTSGLFKGFHRGWGGATGTALYRIQSALALRPPILHDNGAANLALRADAQSLASDLRGILGAAPDVVYIDPPYNQHPYGSNYHVLNTVALWDKPPVHPRIRVAGRPLEKSAIRTDWRTLRRSPYNTARDALPAFRALIAGIDARWILVSYSTDGNIPLEGLLSALSERGSVSVHPQQYKRYRVSTPRMSPRPHNVEFLAVLDARGRPMRRGIDELVSRIAAEDADDPVAARRR